MLARLSPALPFAPAEAGHLEEWPHEARGAEFWRAIENCLADLENKPNTARECFIAAIKAADVSARPPA